MKKSSVIHLHKKGWSHREIREAEDLIKKGHKKKTRFVRILDKSIFWLFLFVMIIGNLFISVSIVPLLLFVKSIFAVIVILALACLLGFLFDLLINDIHNLTRKLYLFAGIIVTMSGFTFSLILTDIVNVIAENSELNIYHNPILIASLYTIALIIPHILITKKEHRELSNILADQKKHL